MKLYGTIHKHNETPINTTWDIINISVSWDTSFKVYYTEYNGKKLIKPYKEYWRSEFEHIFNFGCKCKDYDSERIIDITDAVKS